MFSIDIIKSKETIPGNGAKNLMYCELQAHSIVFYNIMMSRVSSPQGLVLLLTSTKIIQTQFYLENQLDCELENN